MTYFKIFAISVCSSILFLSIFIMVAFDSENTLSKAYEHFANKQYYESRYLLINEDNSIPLADFYLYEAYLAREELGIRKSQGYLFQAIQELSTKKSSTALEITLNLALDAYLQKDVEALQTAIDQSRQYAAPEEPWVHFFTGNLAYLNRDYVQALKSWEASKTRSWLSNWMKTGFENHLSQEQIEFKRLHSEIETGQLWAARKKLEQSLLTLPEQRHDDIRFLLALSYIKESDKLPYDKRSFAYQKSIDLLHQVPANNIYYVQEKQQILNAFKDQILLEISHQHFVDVPLYIATLENWQASEQLEAITINLARMFNENVVTGNSVEAAVLIQGLSKSLPDGEFKRLFTMKLSKQMYYAINKGSLRHLEEYWMLYQNLLEGSSGQTFPVLADATASKILELVENDHSDFEKTSAYINLWKSLEKDPQNRYFLAQQLVQKAQRFWAVQGESQKAITLIKIAELLPFATEQNLLHTDIERAIVKTYRQAVLQDHVDEFPFFQIAVKEFNLSDTEILDYKETANQLADAQYLFHIGRYPIASAKACWVLQTDPENQIARKIAAMTAYEGGRYFEVIEHTKHLKMVEDSISEALAVSQILTGNTVEGHLLLQKISEKQPLTNDTVLHLGFGYLLSSQPDNSILWLDKIHPINDEVLTGLCIAAFQKQDWGKIISLYDQLPSLYNQVPAIQGIAIQALIAQNQIEQANEIFSKFLFSNSRYDIYEDGSKPFILLQTHLSQFDANDFAARYFLHVKKDPANALKKFREVKNPTPELLLERAELAYSLKNYAESIQDLQKSLQSSRGAVREKTLILLGNIYQQLGFYPDSAHQFKELFTLNPLQNPPVHQSYCQALIAIGRFDLASPHFNLLGMALSSPLIAPQELGITLDPHTPAHKRLKMLEFQLTQYPDSISLQMLLAKELLLRSEKSANSSEELLMAYETLEALNEEYSYIPEAWFLQGQVLAQLHFNHSAAKSFAKAISLSPNYAEAYKQLATINSAENDFLAATYNLKQTLQITPHDLSAWNSLAHLYETQHQLADAISAWTQAATLDPKNPTYLIKIAKLNLDLHNPHEAITAIEQALALSPNDNACWKILQQALQHPNNGKISKQGR